MVELEKKFGTNYKGTIDDYETGYRALIERSQKENSRRADRHLRTLHHPHLRRFQASRQIRGGFQKTGRRDETRLRAIPVDV